MGISEYLLRTLIKLIVLTFITVGGALCIRILFIKVKKTKATSLLVLTAFGVYLMAIAYLTVFSRSSAPVVVVELRVFRGIINAIDLFYKFVKSCCYYIVEHVWVGPQRLDINIPYIEEGILNVLMFVPFGYLLPTITFGKKGYKALMIVGGGCCFSLFIEVIQLLTKIGSFDFDDLINNTLGTLIGALLFVKYILPVINLYKKYLSEEVMYDT